MVSSEADERQSNQDQTSEHCTIIVTPRDRFSSTQRCLEHIFQNTPESFELIVVMGGAPPKIREDLTNRFKSKCRFIFEPDFLNTGKLRNIGLHETKTRLAICLDTDVFVRPNWLSPLIQCQLETNASMVTPLVLDRDDLIHTAGNNLFITYANGNAYASMELRYANQKVYESTNIKRQEVDFGEVHCQLVVVETALALGVYDERLREGNDMDSGLTWSKAGHLMMAEPKSMVYLYYPDLLETVEDIPLYVWKWDIPAVMQSYDILKEKWNIAVGGRGRFKKYLVGVNQRVGPLTRLYPSQFTLMIDRVFYYGLKFAHSFGYIRWWFDAWRQGYFKDKSRGPHQNVTTSQENLSPKS